MMAEQLPLNFSGPGYDPAKDGVRLSGLARRVFDFMRDGRWVTIHEVAVSCRGSDTGTAATMRRLRHPDCGGHVVDRRRHPQAGDRGLWQYRLVVNRGC